MKKAHQKTPTTLNEIIGWLGVAAILAAYTLGTVGLVAQRHPLTLTLNLLGAAALLYEARAKRDWQVVALNAIWLLVAGFGLVSLLG